MDRDRDSDRGGKDDGLDFDGGHGHGHGHSHGHGDGNGDQKVHKKWSMLHIVVAVCFGIIFVALLFQIQQGAQAKNIKVGSIVSGEFLGNPSMITTAFLGLRGENLASLSLQDKANMQACDVPGALGILHTGWASNGGSAWANPADVTLCLSASRYPFDTQTCTEASDCLVMHHAPCGSSAPGWNGSLQGNNGQWAWSAQCSMNGGCSFTDATSVSGFCTMPDSVNDVANISCLTDTTSGKSMCHFAALNGTEAGGVVCPFKTCQGTGVTSAPNQNECFSGQICSYSSPENWTGGICMGTPLPHLLLNVPMRAEGTVTGINPDGTFNVFWDHAQVLYNSQGPAVGWNYTECVVTPSSDSINEAARAILFGQGGSWTEGAPVQDPLGFKSIVASEAPPFNLLWDAVLPKGEQLDAILPVVPDMSTQAGPTYSGWSLASNNIPESALTRISTHDIPAQTATTEKMAAWNAQMGLGSGWVTTSLSTQLSGTPYH